MNSAAQIVGAKRAPAAERSYTDTLVITPETVSEWVLPHFQRPKRINDKVRTMAKEIAETEVVPGVLTLGRLQDDLESGVSEVTLYIVDGQHRLESFKESGLKEALANVHVMTFEDMGEMADAFVDLNTALVRMKPDDVLRGLEDSTPVLQKVRAACPFVRYNPGGQGNACGHVSMSLVLRAWFAATQDTPHGNPNSLNTREVLATYDSLSTEQLIIFLKTAKEAWGDDRDNSRLWATLNLSLCAWVFRRQVMGVDVEKGSNANRLTVVQFKRCLMALSADPNYSDWLVGRKLGDRDRGSAYSKMATIFRGRLIQDGVKSARIISPSWSTR
jgi:hypothetical protein